MNLKIIELRQVIQKLVPLLTGKGLEVTQRGARAYVKTDVRTQKPVSVNIPMVPDNSTDEFISAIQGFIDHEVAHVLITDWKYYGGGPTPAQLADPKVQSFINTHNILEDTMIEREIVKIFPGAKQNIANLREHFIKRITKPVVDKAKDDKEKFLYLLVPVMRALAGHDEFQEYLDEGKHWDNPYVSELVKSLDEQFISNLRTCVSTKETLALSRILHDVLYPPEVAPPAPPPPPPPAPPSKSEPKKSEKSEDKPEKEADEGDGDGERDHTESEGEEGESEEDGAAGESSEDGEEGKGGKSSKGKDEKKPSKPKKDKEKSEKGKPEKEEKEEDESGKSDGAGEEDASEEGDEEGADGSGSEQGDEESDTSGSENDDDAEGDSEDGDDADGDAGEDEADGEDEAGDGDGLGEDDEGEDDEGEADGGAGEEGDEEDGEAGEGSVESGGETESFTDSDIEEDSESGDSDVHGVGSTAAKSMFDFKEDAFEGADISSKISQMISKSVTEDLLSSKEYVVFTRELDRIEPLETPENINKKWVPEMEEQVSSMTGRMQKDIERIMASQSHVLRTPGHRKGKLHSPSLFRVTQGDPRVFSQKEEHISKDTAVTLLIDNSGSMSGAKMKLAMLSGYALAATLDRVKIAHEVLGFTTGGWGTVPQAISDAMAEERKVASIAYDRVLPIIMPIYKSFDERMSPLVKKRIAYAMNAQNGLNGNIDGESLEYAAIRLARRPEKRKVMLVLSDGQPAGGPKGDPHLRYVIDNMEKKMGIETVGIGIMDSSVRRYYPKHVVLNKAEDLPGQVMSEIKKLLI